jgi:hypothetical protein
MFLNKNAFIIINKINIYIRKIMDLEKYVT